MAHARANALRHRIELLLREDVSAAGGICDHKNVKIHTIHTVKLTSCRLVAHLMQDVSHHARLVNIEFGEIMNVKTFELDAHHLIVKASKPSITQRSAQLRIFEAVDHSQHLHFTLEGVLQSTMLSYLSIRRSL